MPLKLKPFKRDSHLQWSWKPEEQKAGTVLINILLYFVLMKYLDDTLNYSSPSSHGDLLSLCFSNQVANPQNILAEHLNTLLQKYYHDATWKQWHKFLASVFSLEQTP